MKPMAPVVKTVLAIICAIGLFILIPMDYDSTILGTQILDMAFGLNMFIRPEEVRSLALVITFFPWLASFALAFGAKGMPRQMWGVLRALFITADAYTDLVARGGTRWINLAGLPGQFEANPGAILMSGFMAIVVLQVLPDVVAAVFISRLLADFRKSWDELVEFFVDCLADVNADLYERVYAATVGRREHKKGLAAQARQRVKRGGQAPQPMRAPRSNGAAHRQAALNGIQRMAAENGVSTLTLEDVAAMRSQTSERDAD